jgi:cytochrome o ubiquinol oxidase subunit 3
MNTHDETLVEARENEAKTTFGFWVYIMTDCVLFASLFATYAVLHGNTAGGPDAKELFHLPLVLVETMALLTSSFSCGLAVLASRNHDRRQTLLWLALTCILGLVFLGIELGEFRSLYVEGNSWRRSGFLSAFFTLVGTHGAHITVGLMWLITMAVRISRSGFTAINLRRLALFSVFWHFLDLIWIFIFTIVYLSGGLGL